MNNLEKLEELFILIKEFLQNQLNNGLKISSSLQGKKFNLI